ncbi:hypothetical protein PPECC9_45970 [Escherichia coli PCN009]|nr:hypothetical protein AD12_3628 [Escherichia coli 1-392-07_S4_C2]EZK28967.1 hypothetical protein AB12_3057 [Escherichia coli 1-182-04_S1_C1]KDA67590.1 hypothetical protein AB40_3054 [Escherichia coli 1-182-04_S1_C2]OAF88871.1 hypothetical protein PPECC9_45970 [Escherichia coli PCN009]
MFLINIFLFTRSSQLKNAVLFNVCLQCGHMSLYLFPFMSEYQGSQSNPV